MSQPTPEQLKAADNIEMQRQAEAYATKLGEDISATILKANQDNMDGTLSGPDRSLWMWRLVSLLGAHGNPLPPELVRKTVLIDIMGHPPPRDTVSIVFNLYAQMAEDAVAPKPSSPIILAGR